MNDTVWWVSGCITALLLFAMLVAGPTACSISQQREASRRIEAICTGDLKADATRAAACILATTNAKNAGQ